MNIQQKLMPDWRQKIVLTGILAILLIAVSAAPSWAASYAISVADNPIYESGATTTVTFTCSGGGCNKTLTVTSSDTNVATVSLLSYTADTEAVYTVTSVNAGTVTLEGRSDGNIKSTVDLVVDPNTFTLTVADPTILAGTGSTTATLTCSGNCNQDLSLNDTSGDGGAVDITEISDDGNTATYTLDNGTAGTITLEGLYNAIVKITETDILTVAPQVLTLSVADTSIYENELTTATLTCTGTCAANSLNLTATTGDVTILETSEIGGGGNL